MGSTRPLNGLQESMNGLHQAMNGLRESMNGLHQAMNGLRESIFKLGKYKIALDGAASALGAVVQDNPHLRIPQQYGSRSSRISVASALTYAEPRMTG
jgi:hypothetical protein